jgi:hypothetical protein
LTEANPGGKGRISILIPASLTVTRHEGPSSRAMSR